MLLLRCYGEEVEEEASGIVVDDTAPADADAAAVDDDGGVK